MAGFALEYRHGCYIAGAFDRRGRRSALPGRGGADDSALRVGSDRNRRWSAVRRAVSGARRRCRHRRQSFFLG